MKTVTVYDNHIWPSDGKCPNYKPDGAALCGHKAEKATFIWQVSSEKLLNERWVCEKCRRKLRS